MPGHQHVFLKSFFFNILNRIYQVLQRLQDAWVNEKFSPELLEPQIEIVDCLMEQISRTEDHVNSLEKGNFAIALHKMELQRIRFLVSGLNRC